MAERFFRRAKHIPTESSLAAFGWSFEGNRFALSRNVGLDSAGVVFHWNAYEIGPYVAGPTRLVVPYDSLRGALAAAVTP